MKSTWFFLVIEFSWGVIITSFFGRKKGCVVNFYSFVPVFFVLVHYREQALDRKFLSCPKIKGSTYTVSYHTQPSPYLLNIWNNMKIWPFCVKSLIFEKLGCRFFNRNIQFISSTLYIAREKLNSNPSTRCWSKGAKGSACRHFSKIDFVKNCRRARSA